MKDPLPTADKTSRRRFTKTIASALVVVPVISSLSSCAKSGSDGGGTTASPCPQPSVAPQVERGANPPVIIDGGSFQLMFPGKLKREADNETAPRPYRFKYTQKPKNSLGPITGIRIVDDYADERLKETLIGANPLQVWIWKAMVKTDTDDPDNDINPGKIEYEGISDKPDIVIQGGKIQIRTDADINEGDRIFKREKRNQREHHVHDWESGTSHFRLAKVRVLVGANQIYDSSATGQKPAEYGYRIILLFA